MTAYSLIICANAIGCINLQFTWDLHEEAPKHNKLQFKSHMLQIFFGIIGAFSSQTIFVTASRTVRLITCIVMCIILLISIIFQVWAWCLIWFESKNKKKGGLL